MSKAWFCCRWLTRDCGFESRRSYGCSSLVSVVCCQVEVLSSGWSPSQRSHDEFGVSECDRETSIRRRPWPIRGCCTTEGRDGWKWVLVSCLGRFVPFKYTNLHIGKQSARATQSVSTFRRRNTILDPARNRTTIPRSSIPYHRHYTDWANLDSTMRADDS
jgi:hypothetical protein